LAQLKRILAVLALSEGLAMTLCPVAIAVGCQKCPAFKVCPLKSVIGDSPKPDASKPEAQKTAAKGKK
jgi:ABC-type nickel/cobalt efflux system permease component RcnA